jgi:hypothetical protein
MKGKKPLYKSVSRGDDLTAKLLALGRPTFARMVMKASLPVADSRALLRAYDEAKR